MNHFYEVNHNNEVKDIRKIFKEKNDKMKIFCPECNTAKLFIRGKDKNKFIIDQPTSEHLDTCSYKYRHFNFKEAKAIFSSNEYKMDELLKVVYQERQKGKHVGNVVVDYKAKTKILTKSMPLINIEDINSDMLNLPNVFYGKADLELIKSGRGYIIKVSASKSQFQYFVINVSENTYKHLDDDFKKAKRIREVDFIYYGVLTLDSKKWKTSTLVNTKHLIFK